ncbi:hypothetical protein B0J11DRAFT_599523 [Dendryphion nanum]|uniref:Uncharacterized protein n=1 Tax=Dendryphion nanum TaxID=256645 RepID=A0A9P9D0A2_9PLEO|nr:hypothetical protein B0J11DRAFT_599523 [Dendryphion nanum]
MAEFAQRRLSAPTLDVETVALLQHIFANPGQDPRSIDLYKLRYVFRLILQSCRTERTGPVPYNSMDVVIYCDDSRLRSLNSPTLLGHIYQDTSNGVYLFRENKLCPSNPKNQESAINERGFDDLFMTTLAMTSNPRIETFVNGIKTRENRPTQIQLCDSFINSLKKTDMKNAKDVIERTRFQNAITGKGDPSNHFKDIDAVGDLLDVTLLHEMTHARIAWVQPNPYFDEVRNGEDDKDDKDDKDDRNVEPIIEGLADVKVRDPSRFFTKVSAYGWSRITRLAREGPSSGETNLGAADHNSDSYAMFGAALHFDDLPAMIHHRRVKRTTIVQDSQVQMRRKEDLDP